MMVTIVIVTLLIVIAIQGITGSLERDQMKKMNYSLDSIKLLLILALIVLVDKDTESV